MKIFFGTLTVLAIGIIGGCAMFKDDIVKTGKGENIATGNVLNDKHFQGWHLVKIAFDGDKKSAFYGVQATYMNSQAFDAFKNDAEFPEDSKVVLAFFDFFIEGTVVVPEKKAWSAMMWKKPTAKSTSGGWVYSSVDYKTLEPKISDPIAVCYITCHKSKADSDYLYIKEKFKPSK